MKVNIKVFGLHVSANLGLRVQTDISRRAEELQEEIDYLPVEKLLDTALGYKRAYEAIRSDHVLDSYRYEGREVDLRGEALAELLDDLDESARDAAPSIRTAAPPSMQAPGPRVILWEDTVGIVPKEVHPGTPSGFRSVGRYCGR